MFIHHLSIGVPALLPPLGCCKEQVCTNLPETLFSVLLDVYAEVGLLDAVDPVFNSQRHCHAVLHSPRGVVYTPWLWVLESRPVCLLENMVNPRSADQVGAPCAWLPWAPRKALEPVPWAGPSHLALQRPGPHMPLGNGCDYPL